VLHQFADQRALVAEAGIDRLRRHARLFGDRGDARPPVAALDAELRSGSEHLPAGPLRLLEPQLRPDHASGPEGVKAVVTSLRRAFPDFRLQIEDLTVDRGKVWLRMVGGGINDGPFMGNPPTRRRMRTNVFDVIRVASPTGSARSSSSDSNNRPDHVRSRPRPRTRKPLERDAGTRSAYLSV
jgi:hypothetical protein